MRSLAGAPGGRSAVREGGDFLEQIPRPVAMPIACPDGDGLDNHGPQRRPAVTGPALLTFSPRLTLHKARTPCRQPKDGARLPFGSVVAPPSVPPHVLLDAV